MKNNMETCSKCKQEIKENHWAEWNQYDGHFHHNCDSPETPDLTKEQNDQALDFLTKLSNFASKKTDLCPHCDKKVNQCQKISLSVYLYPCGCRLWTGDVPKAWREKTIDERIVEAELKLEPIKKKPESKEADPEKIFPDLTDDERDMLDNGDFMDVLRGRMED